MGTIYELFGVEPLINASGTKTSFGGSLMAPEAVEAAAEAALYSVDIAELQAAASRLIARVTGAEAGYVSSGAAAGLTLAAAACMTGSDPAKIDRLPDTAGMRDEIVMLRGQRNAYDHALRAAGARITDVGLNDRYVSAGVRGVDPWEIDAAITDRTAAVAFVGGHEELITLECVVETAHARGVPVIVDAAAQLPPVENLTRFIRQGADLVVFSGGKALRGPQATGILCGRADLIQAVALHHLDWDTDTRLWEMPVEFRPPKPTGLPHHGIGRGFKVSKENLVALLVALRRFATGAVTAEQAEKAPLADAIAVFAKGLPGLLVSTVPKRGYPTVQLKLRSVEEAIALYRHLFYGRPRVAADSSRIDEGVVQLNTVSMRPGDELKVIEALKGWRG